MKSRRDYSPICEEPFAEKSICSRVSGQEAPKMRCCNVGQGFFCCETAEESGTNDKKIVTGRRKSMTQSLALFLSLETDPLTARSDLFGRYLPPQPATADF